MCGIAALIQNNNQPIDLKRFHTSLNTIKHRGPDNSGVNVWGNTIYSDELASKPYPQLSPRVNTALGHQRLSILDLSQDGHQPMSYRNNLWITYNGEIYNYKEIKQELILLGHEFASKTDTEVILAAYSEWGANCVQKFNGMWAFVILDTQRLEIFASRDRFGIKPCYFAIKDNKISFASEIKQLNSLNFHNQKINFGKASSFLSYGSVNNTRETMFENIQQLLPGENFHFKLSDDFNKIAPYKFYDLSNINFIKTLSPSDWQKQYTELLYDSLRLRLRSDVEVGACLSGGLDSSAIVSIVHQLIPSLSMKTFTSCSKTKKYDESAFAELINNYTNSKGHKIYPDLNNLFSESMNNLLYHQDEPFTSTSIFAQWNVMSLAADNGIKVLLDGQGADEVLGGYKGYIPYLFADLIKTINIFNLYKISTNLKDTKTFSESAIYSGCKILIKHLIKGASKGLNLHLGDDKLLRQDAKGSLISPKSHSNYNNKLIYDMQNSLQTLLRYEDRNSMAFSIEARTPFLDYRLVEHTFKCKLNERYKFGYTKAPLREAIKGNSPDNVRLRTDKKAFVTEESLWYQQNKDQINKTLMSSDYLNTWIEMDQLKKRLNDYRGDNDFFFWRLYCFNQWAKYFNLRT